MVTPRTRDTPKTRRAKEVQHAPRFRVLLHNDDVNDTNFVTHCLIEVLSISAPNARAIMSEAHCTGVAICTIESRPEAEHHRDRLRAFGLSSTIEAE